MPEGRPVRYHCPMSTSMDILTHALRSHNNSCILGDESEHLRPYSENPKAITHVGTVYLVSSMVVPATLH